jgi:hypothetical protein
MQLVSQNFSLDDVARLPGPNNQVLRRLLAQYERTDLTVPQEALSLLSFVVSQKLDNSVNPLVRFETTSDLFMPDNARPLFCSSTHAPGRSHCMCHCMHHC